MDNGLWLVLLVSFDFACVSGGHPAMLRRQDTGWLLLSSVAVLVENLRYTIGYKQIAQYPDVSQISFLTD